MPYYVVNVRTGGGGVTTGTHIMESKTPTTPGRVSDQVANFVYFGGTLKHTLCGREAGRYVDVFEPSEASCRECRKRWQLAVAASAADAQRRSALTRDQRAEEDRKKKAAKSARDAVRAAIVGFVIVIAVIWMLHQH